MVTFDMRDMKKPGTRYPLGGNSFGGGIRKK
jgi:hypothetical protein